MLSRAENQNTQEPSLTNRIFGSLLGLLLGADFALVAGIPYVFY